ncbi:hypothetical protein HYC85_007552 [Camellia sinensis]|uniref:Xyloglucan endotransglucosylase/hydrolase n=1 Tax=Camellia sinensis TaxID=4442 RepID=A0A7J7HRJ7_CAMSI|nr:hypothetical protein HYC85_007552 [Camellia sinensis]
MQLKLVAGNSAGTVTAYCLSSQGPTHDEIDFEFLGNLSGDPYIVHTNVFTQGKGNREQQFYLWFDPTRNFHTYSIVWISQQIIFLVDNTPIRVFKNGESIGVPFPKNQPMKIYSSLWNADDWATRGGLVKADWTKAPFTAYYRGFNVQTCTGSCTSSVSGRTWQNQELDAYSRRRLRWVQKNFMISNYCWTDIDIDIDQWCRRTNHHLQPHLRISLSLSLSFFHFQTHILFFKPNTLSLHLITWACPLSLLRLISKSLIFYLFSPNHF